MWVKVYVVEVVWVDEVFVENHGLSTGLRSVGKLVLLSRHHLKEVQSKDYIQDLFFLDL